MRIHTIKLYDLDPIEIYYIRTRLSYYIEKGVGLRILKKTAYLYFTDEQNYCGIFNMLYFYWNTDRMSVNKRDRKWIDKYMRL